MSPGNRLVIAYAAVFPLLVAGLFMALRSVRRVALRNGGKSWGVFAAIPGATIALLVVLVASGLIAPNKVQVFRKAEVGRRLSTLLDDETRKREGVYAHFLTKWRAEVPARVTAAEIQWEWTARDGAFPLSAMDAAAADAFVRERTERVRKDLERFALPRLDAVANHCQVRMWNADGGSWARPLFVLLLTPAEPFSFSGPVDVAGHGLAAGGYPVRPAWRAGISVMSGGPGDFAHDLLFDYVGNLFWVYPVGKAGEVEPGPGWPLGRRFALPRDTPIDRQQLARTQHSSLRARSDRQFDLRLDTLEGPVIHRLTIPDSDWLRALVDDPYAPPGVDFPVVIEFDPATQGLSIVVETDRDHLRWLATHQGETRRVSTFALRRMLPAAGEAAVVDPRQIIAYETNYQRLPRVDAQMRCVGQLPELRLLLDPNAVAIHAEQ
jgi:hypothetical protein